MNENKILIFQHIPKTAGSTLRSILKKHYNSDEICIANRDEMIKKLNDLSKFATHGILIISSLKGEALRLG